MAANVAQFSSNCLSVLLLWVQIAAGQGEWRQGRATFFGAPFSYSAAFDPYRGKGSFGTLQHGSCGFTSSDATGMPFPRDAVAAMADTNPDYPGSCGRCYQVKCKEGLVLTGDGQPVNISSMFYMPKANPKLPDTFNRTYPGNPAEAQGQLYTKCYNESKTLIVRIIDTCPCTQVLPDGAPGVRKGGEVRKQLVCCGGPAGIAHFDLAYWAFEQLAHPLSGRMMLQYRPVDCDTGEPLQYLPGYINKDVIYKNGTKAGWNWFPYFAAYKKYAYPNIAPDGSDATCVNLSKNGALSFHVKQGDAAGLQPFAGVTHLRFLIRSNARTKKPEESSTPRGQVPNLKVFIHNFETSKYCNSDVRLGSYQATEVPLGPNAKSGDSWFEVTVPFKDFKCDYEGAYDYQVDRIDMQNTEEKHALFCLAELRLLREGGSGGGTGPQQQQGTQQQQQQQQQPSEQKQSGSRR